MNLKHYNSNPTAVEIDGKIYRFVAKFNVSLCENIPDEDAEKILQIRAKICCGRNSPKFRVANENDISIWHTGHI